MICPQCHSPNPDDASACSFCGAERAVTRITNIGAVADQTANLVTAVEKREPRKIAGRYALLSFLGRGSAGVVFRALDEKLGEEVALKVLLPGLTSDPGEIARLKREVVTARKITHPNVIRLHDFGEEGGSAFLSMELLTGGTLYERIQRAPPAPAEAVELAIGIADGLGAAHVQDVVHRDVKPQNVLLDSRGTVKLADFGLARVTVATTRTVGFAGTPQYMSPETIDDKPSTPRSDVYSLGVLLFELLTGRLPFTADTLIRLALMHMNDRPPRPSSLRSGIPASLDEVVLQALEKDPARRFENGNEFAAALRAVGRDEITRATGTATGEGLTPTVSPVIAPPPSAETTEPRAEVKVAAPRPAAVTAPLAPRPAAAPEAPAPEASPRRKALPGRADSLASAEAARRRMGIRWSIALGVVSTIGLWFTLSPPWQAASTPTPLPTEKAATPLAVVTPPLGTATLVLHAWPKVGIWIDDEKIGETEAMPPTEVTAGEHVVRVRSDAHHFGMEKKVHFEQGRETFIRVDQRDGAFEVTTRSRSH